MSDGSNGHAETDEEREWREHQERFDAVRALERRLGSMESRIELGFQDMRTAVNQIRDLLTEHMKEQRRNADDFYKLWVQLVDRQRNTETAVAALETKPRVAKKRK